MVNTNSLNFLKKQNLYLSRYIFSSLSCLRIGHGHGKISLMRMASRPGGGTLAGECKRACDLANVSEHKIAVYICRPESRLQGGTPCLPSCFARQRILTRARCYGILTGVSAIVASLCLAKHEGRQGVSPWRRDSDRRM